MNTKKYISWVIIAVPLAIFALHASSEIANRPTHKVEVATSVRKVPDSYLAHGEPEPLEVYAERHALSQSLLGERPWEGRAALGIVEKFLSALANGDLTAIQAIVVDDQSLRDRAARLSIKWSRDEEDESKNLELLLHSVGDNTAKVRLLQKNSKEPTGTVTLKKIKRQWMIVGFF